MGPPTPVDVGAVLVPGAEAEAEPLPPGAEAGAEPVSPGADAEAELLPPTCSAPESLSDDGEAQADTQADKSPTATIDDEETGFESEAMRIRARPNDVWTGTRDPFATLRSDAGGPRAHSA